MIHNNSQEGDTSKPSTSSSESSVIKVPSESIHQPYFYNSVPLAMNINLPFYNQLNVSNPYPHPAILQPYQHAVYPNVSNPYQQQPATTTIQQPIIQQPTTTTIQQQPIIHQHTIQQPIVQQPIVQQHVPVPDIQQPTAIIQQQPTITTIQQPTIQPTIQQPTTTTTTQQHTIQPTIQQQPVSQQQPTTIIQQPYQHYPQPYQHVLYPNISNPYQQPIAIPQQPIIQPPYQQHYQQHYQQPYQQPYQHAVCPNILNPYQQPITDIQQPTATQQSTTAIQQPITAIQQSTAAIQQPTTAIQQPTAAIQQPTTAIQQPYQGVLNLNTSNLQVLTAPEPLTIEPSMSSRDITNGQSYTLKDLLESENTVQKNHLNRMIVESTNRTDRSNVLKASSVESLRNNRLTGEFGSYQEFEKAALEEARNSTESSSKAQARCSFNSFLKFHIKRGEEFASEVIMPPAQGSVIVWLWSLAKLGYAYNTITSYAAGLLSYVRDFLKVPNFKSIPGIIPEDITKTLTLILKVYGNNEESAVTFTTEEYAIVQTIMYHNPPKYFKNLTLLQAMLGVHFLLGQRADSITFMKQKDLSISVSRDKKVKIVYSIRKMKTFLSRPHKQTYESSDQKFNCIDANHLLLNYLIGRNSLEGVDSSWTVDALLEKFSHSSILVKKDFKDEYLFPCSSANGDLKPNNRLSTIRVGIQYRRMFSYCGSTLKVTAHSPRRSCVTAMLEHQLDSSKSYEEGISMACKWIGWKGRAMAQKYVDEKTLEKIPVGNILFIDASVHPTQSEDDQDGQSSDNTERVRHLEGDEDEEDEEEMEEDLNEGSDEEDNEEDDEENVIDVDDEEVHINEEDNDLLPIDRFHVSPSTKNLTQKKPSLHLKYASLPNRLSNRIFDIFKQGLDVEYKEKAGERMGIERKYLTFIFHSDIKLYTLQVKKMVDYENYTILPNDINKIRSHILVEAFFEREEYFLRSVSLFFDESYRDKFYTVDAPIDIYRSDIKIPTSLYKRALEYRKETMNVQSKEFQKMEKRSEKGDVYLDSTSVACVFSLAKLFISRSPKAQARLKSIFPDVTVAKNDYQREKPFVVVLVKEYHLKGDSMFSNLTPVGWDMYHIPDIDERNPPKIESSRDMIFIEGYQERFTVPSRVKNGELIPERYLEWKIIELQNMELNEFDEQGRLMKAMKGTRTTLKKEAKTEFVRSRALMLRSEKVRKEIEQIPYIQNNFFIEKGGNYQPLSAFTNASLAGKLNVLTGQQLQTLCEELNIEVNNNVKSTLVKTIISKYSNKAIPATIEQFYTERMEEKKELKKEKKKREKDSRHQKFVDNLQTTLDNSIKISKKKKKIDDTENDKTTKKSKTTKKKAVVTEVKKRKKTNDSEEEVSADFVKTAKKRKSETVVKTGISTKNKKHDKTITVDTESDSELSEVEKKRKPPTKKKTHDKTITVDTESDSELSEVEKRKQPSRSVKRRT